MHKDFFYTGRKRNVPIYSGKILINQGSMLIGVKFGKGIIALIIIIIVTFLQE